MRGMQPTHVVPLLVGFLAIGCGDPARAPVGKASYDPEGAAKAALREADKDGDGSLAGAELDASPAIKSALARFDTNKDKKVSLDELKAFDARVEADVFDVLSLEGSLNARNVLGGTAPAQVRAQVARHRARLA